MKKFILSSVVLLLFILISGCDKNDKNVEFSVYEFYFELVDENGNPFIDNMDDMETLADKMELKWQHPCLPSLLVETSWMRNLRDS